MFTAKSVWGIDIGDSCIKAVRLSAGEESITVEDFDYVELDAELKKKEGFISVISDAIETISARKDFTKTEVCISISAKSVNSRFISIESELKPKEMLEEVKSEAEKQIPFPLEDVEWGYHQFPDRDDQGQVALFAVRSEHITEILGVIDNAGLKVRGVQVPGVALYNFISAISDVEQHMVVLDFGEKTTDLLIMHNNAFWLRSLPLSGSQITELLEKKFRITTKEANTLKHEMEKSNQQEKLFRVIEPKLKELVIEIKRSLNFRKTQVEELKPTNFLAFGGSSQLPGAAAYFSKNLKLDDFKVDFSALDFDECDGSEEITKNIASYGVAFGLALQGIGPTEVSLNLIPKKYLLDKLLKAKRLTAIVANALFLLMVVMIYIAGGSVTESLNEGLKSIQDKRSKIQQNISKYDGLKNGLLPTKANLEYFLKVQKGNKYIAKIYNEVCRLMNKTKAVYLVSFKIDNLESAQLMEVIDILKYNKDQLKAPYGDSEIEVYLSYIGENATVNREFYNELLKSPMFKIRDGMEVPVPDGGTKNYSWEYTPKISTAIVDPFASIEEVLAMRKEKGWEIIEGKPVVRNYEMDQQVLIISVNKAYLYGLMMEEAK